MLRPCISCSRRLIVLFVVLGVAAVVVPVSLAPLTLSAPSSGAAARRRVGGGGRSR